MMWGAFVMFIHSISLLFIQFCKEASDAVLDSQDARKNQTLSLLPTPNSVGAGEHKKERDT